MRSIFLAICFLTTIFINVLSAIPLSKEIIEQLQNSGKLEEVLQVYADVGWQI
jgi:hypothetical protein